jgi:hypothetical protein
VFVENGVILRYREMVRGNAAVVKREQRDG